MYEIIIFVYMRYFTTIFVLLLFACSLNKDDINNIDIFRFENQIFQTNGSNIVADRLEWEGEVGSFAFSYYNFLFNSNNDTIINNQILSFINNDDMREVYDTINLRFSSISNLKNDLGNSLYNFKTLFSEYPTPNIITMFSGFNYGVIVEDSIVAIGLDFYLGKNSIFYQRLGDPEYLRFQKQARFITPNILEAWYDSFFSFPNKRTNFLSELIYKGKIMYLNLIKPNKEKLTSFVSFGASLIIISLFDILFNTFFDFNIKFGMESKSDCLLIFNLSNAPAFARPSN